MSDQELALEQMHIAPVDELDHVMSAFCPCSPAFEEATCTDEDDVETEAILYRHNPMPRTSDE